MGLGSCKTEQPQENNMSKRLLTTGYNKGFVHTIVPLHRNSRGNETLLYRRTLIAITILLELWRFGQRHDLSLQKLPPPPRSMQVGCVSCVRLATFPENPVPSLCDPKCLPRIRQYMLCLLCHYRASEPYQGEDFFRTRLALKLRVQGRRLQTAIPPSL